MPSSSLQPSDPNVTLGLPVATDQEEQYQEEQRRDSNDRVNDLSTADEYRDFDDAEFAEDLQAQEQTTTRHSPPPIPFSIANIEPRVDDDEPAPPR